MIYFLRKMAVFAATGAGVGYLPGIPGTFGTCLAIPLSLALNQLAIYSSYGALLILLGCSACAVWLAGKAANILGVRDPPVIVLDEMVGFLIANLFNQPDLAYLLLTFILFRFFDIVKPFPIGIAEKLPGGFGIVLDDVVAGAYTLAIARLMVYWSVM